jgi:hypothetical protein
VPLDSFVGCFKQTIAYRDKVRGGVFVRFFVARLQFAMVDLYHVSSLPLDSSYVD